MIVSDDDIKAAKILIIDDDQRDIQLLTAFLKDEGFQSVNGITDSRNSVKLYFENEFDLILLDLNMPYLDGFEVMKKFHSIDKPIHPPVLVLTGLHDDDIKIRALREGARDFVEKAFNAKEIISRVTNLLDMFLSHKRLNNYSTLLENAVFERTTQLLKTQSEVIERLALVAEYRDSETSAHTVRVGHYSKLLAQQLGFSDEEAELLFNAAPMHDIGKIGIPDSILLKPDNLNEKEWKIMQNHTYIGASIFDHGSTKLMQCAKTVALTHHEKWNGSGYPEKLAGKQIPVYGRIVKIVDVFDALTTIRPYKQAWSTQKAASLIAEESGTSFDPEITSLFIKILPEIEHIREKYTDS